MSSVISQFFGDQLPLVLVFFAMCLIAIISIFNTEFNDIAHDAFIAFISAAGMRALPAKRP